MKIKTKFISVGGGNSNLSDKMYKLVISQYGSDILGSPSPIIIEVIL